MRTFTDGKLTAYAPDYLIYRSDRIIIQVRTLETQSSILNVYLNDGYDNTIQMIINNPLRGVTYSFDITDVIRTRDDDDDIYVSVTDGINTIDEEIDVNIKGLINPKYLPPHPIIHTYVNYNEEYVVCPSRILKDLGENFPQNTIECQGDFVGNTGISYGGDSENTKTLNNLNTIPHGADIIKLYEEVSGIIENIRSIKIAPLLDCAKYACVRWISRTGFQKVATWKVRQVQEETTERLELLRNPSVYNVANTHPIDVRKKYDVNLRLFLDGLTAYDYWYYCDIINSPQVEVFLNGGNENAEVNIVDVLTKSATYPDSDVNAPYELDVEIKLNEYGTY